MWKKYSHFDLNKIYSELNFNKLKKNANRFSSEEKLKKKEENENSLEEISKNNFNLSFEYLQSGDYKKSFELIFDFFWNYSGFGKSEVFYYFPGRNEFLQCLTSILIEYSLNQFDLNAARFLIDFSKEIFQESPEQKIDYLFLKIKYFFIEKNYKKIEKVIEKIIIILNNEINNYLFILNYKIKIYLVLSQLFLELRQFSISLSYILFGLSISSNLCFPVEFYEFLLHLFDIFVFYSEFNVSREDFINLMDSFIPPLAHHHFPLILKVKFYLFYVKTHYHFYFSQNTKIENDKILENCLNYLKIALADVIKLNSKFHLREIYYYFSLFYSYLDDKKNRNSFARLFKSVDEEISSHSTSYLPDSFDFSSFFKPAVPPLFVSNFLSVSYDEIRQDNEDASVYANKLFSVLLLNSSSNYSTSISTK